MFEGDLEEGELEIGQIAGLINEVLPAAQIIDNFIEEYDQALKNLKDIYCDS
jgi:enoyl-[acyl-carrier protein] reductase II